MRKLLLLLLLLIPSNVYATTTWESYSDSARTVWCDTFASGNVYMKGEVQKNKDYTAKFYDADMDLLQVEVGVADGNGVFLSMIQPNTFPNSTAGTWKAELWKVQPVTLLETDTFTVLPSAIPELTVFAAVWISFICILTYWLMAKRRRR